MTDNNNELTRKKQAVNAYQKAIALQYEGVGAPVVTATGEGVIAEDIIALARELGIPLYENPELTEMLAMLELGDEIPHELYIIIAQIIALAYNIKGIIPDSMDHFPRS
jgi:flagellar biosynthesis protein